MRWVTVPLLAVLAAASCGRLEPWDDRSWLPRHFDTADVLALGQEEGLIAGCVDQPEDGSPTEVRRRQGTILRVVGDSVTVVFSAAQSVVKWLSSREDRVWALLVKLDGNGLRADVWLLRSDDRGVTWYHIGPIPDHASEILAVGAEEVWVLGVSNLARTIDGGRTWKSVAAPGRRNPIEERLAVNQGRLVLLGNGILQWDADAESWSRIPIEGRVYLLDENIVVAGIGEKVRIGRLSSGSNHSVDWLHTFDDFSPSPFDIVVEGSSIRLSMVPDGQLMGIGIGIYESTNGGIKWKAGRVSAMAWHDALDLGPSGSGIAVDPAHRVLMPRPRKESSTGGAVGGRDP